ncbi:LamG domain-containing protein [Candidatus Latescibacterota bacterium]
MRRSHAVLLTLTLTVVVTAGCRQVDLAVPRQDLAIELLMSGDARDTSDNGHHGKIEGATPATDRFGREGMALHFDGDDWILVSPPPALSDQAITVSLWARYDSSEFRWWNNCMLAQDNGSDDGDRRIIQLSTHWRSIDWHRMGEAEDANSPVIIEPDVWYHIAATYDGHNHRLYVDGLLHDTRSGSLRQHSEEPLFVGRKGSDETDFTFRGVLDDVRIYNRALSGEEIARLYQETIATGED